MIRTTVTLPEELAELVAHEARRTGASASEVVRRALAEHLGHGATGRRPLAFAAAGRSGKRSTARDAEKILAADWGARGVRRR